MFQLDKSRNLPFRFAKFFLLWRKNVRGGHTRARKRDVSQCYPTFQAYTRGGDGLEVATAAFPSCCLRESELQSCPGSSFCGDWESFCKSSLLLLGAEMAVRLEQPIKLCQRKPPFLTHIKDISAKITCKEILKWIYEGFFSGRGSATKYWLRGSVGVILVLWGVNRACRVRYYWAILVRRVGWGNKELDSWDN